MEVLARRVALGMNGAPDRIDMFVDSVSITAADLIHFAAYMGGDASQPWPGAIIPRQPDPNP